MKFKLIKRRLSTGDIKKEESKKGIKKQDDLKKKSVEPTLSSPQESPICSPQMQPRSRAKSLENIGTKSYFKSPKFLRRKKDDENISNANLVYSTYTGNFEPLIATLERKRRGELIDSYEENRALKNSLVKKDYLSEVHEQKILEDVKEEDLDALKELLSEFVDVNDNLITPAYDNFNALPSPNQPLTPNTTPNQFQTTGEINNLSRQSSQINASNLDDSLIDKLLALKKDKEMNNEKDNEKKKENQDHVFTPDTFNIERNIQGSLKTIGCSENGDQKSGKFLEKTAKLGLEAQQKLPDLCSSDSGITGIKITINDGQRFEDEYTYTSGGLSRSGSVDSLLNEMDDFITQSVSDEIERDFSVHDKTKIMEYTITGKISPKKEVYKNYVIDKKSFVSPLISDPANITKNHSIDFNYTFESKEGSCKTVKTLSPEKTLSQNKNIPNEEGNLELMLSNKSIEFQLSTTPDFSQDLKKSERKTDSNSVVELNTSNSMQNYESGTSCKVKQMNDETDLTNSSDELEILEYSPPNSVKKKLNVDKEANGYVIFASKLADYIIQDIKNNFKKLALDYIRSISSKRQSLDEAIGNSLTFSKSSTAKLTNEIVKSKLIFDQNESKTKTKFNECSKNTVNEPELKNENLYLLEQQEQNEHFLKCEVENINLKTNEIKDQCEILKNGDSLSDAVNILNEFSEELRSEEENLNANVGGFAEAHSYVNEIVIPISKPINLEDSEKLHFESNTHEVARSTQKVSYATEIMKSRVVQYPRLTKISKELHYGSLSFDSDVECDENGTVLKCSEGGTAIKENISTEKVELNGFDKTVTKSFPNLQSSVGSLTEENDINNKIAPPHNNSVPLLEEIPQAKENLVEEPQFEKTLLVEAHLDETSKKEPLIEKYLAEQFNGKEPSEKNNLVGKNLVEQTAANDWFEKPFPVEENQVNETSAEKTKLEETSDDRLLLKETPVKETREKTFVEKTSVKVISVKEPQEIKTPVQETIMEQTLEKDIFAEKYSTETPEKNSGKTPVKETFVDEIAVKEALSEEIPVEHIDEETSKSQSNVVPVNIATVKITTKDNAFNASQHVSDFLDVPPLEFKEGNDSDNEENLDKNTENQQNCSEGVWNLHEQNDVADTVSNLMNTPFETPLVELKKEIPNDISLNALADQLPADEFDGVYRLNTRNIIDISEDINKIENIEKGNNFKKFEITTNTDDINTIEMTEEIAKTFATENTNIIDDVEKNELEKPDKTKKASLRKTFKSSQTESQEREEISNLLSRREVLVRQLLGKLASQKLSDDMGIYSNHEENELIEDQIVPERKYKKIEKRSKTFDASNKEEIQEKILTKLKKNKVSKRPAIFSSAKSFDHGSRKSIYEDQDEEDYEYVNEKAKKISNIAFLILKTCREEMEDNEIEQPVISECDQMMSTENEIESQTCSDLITKRDRQDERPTLIPSPGLKRKSKLVFDSIEDNIECISLVPEETGIDFSKVMHFNTLDEKIIEQNKCIQHLDIMPSINVKKDAELTEINLTESCTNVKISKNLVDERILSPTYLDADKAFDFGILRKSNKKSFVKAKSLSHMDEPVSQRENHGVYKLSDCPQICNIETITSLDTDQAEAELKNSKFSKPLGSDEESQISERKTFDEEKNLDNNHKVRHQKFSRPSLENIKVFPDVNLQSQVLRSIHLDEVNEADKCLQDTDENNDKSKNEINAEILVKNKQTTENMGGNVGSQKGDFDLQMFSSTFDIDDSEDHAYENHINNPLLDFSNEIREKNNACEKVTFITKPAVKVIGITPKATVRSKNAVIEQTGFKSKITVLPKHHIKIKSGTPSNSNTTSQDQIINLSIKEKELKAADLEHVSNKINGDQTATDCCDENSFKTQKNYFKDGDDSNLSIQLKSVNRPQMVTVELRSSGQIKSESKVKISKEN